MKKATAVLLALLMLIPFATIAFAANTTTLTTTVPGAVYTLNIPSDQEIAYGVENTIIDAPTVTDSSGFAEGKNLYVTVTYSDFTSPTTDTTIPFKLENSNGGDTTLNWYSELTKVVFTGNRGGTVSENLTFENANGKRFTAKNSVIHILSSDWGKAMPGNYTATITYTAEIGNS